jgi:hypothetical protein
VTQEARRTADAIGSHPALIALARVGHVVNGLLHVVIAVIALQVAWGGGGGQADQSGAFAALASQPLGTVTLWVFVVGAGALALWYLTEVVSPPSGESEATDRAKSGAKAVVYAAIAWTAVRFAAGSGSSGSSEEQTQGVTQTLMSYPAGQVLVAAVGLVVIGVGAYYVRKGVTHGFLGDLTKNPGVLATSVGTFGYPAKGVVLALVGVFFVVAAWQQESEEATGLDGALKSLKDQPFGPYLLTAVALGILAFGLYCFVRARYAKLD